MIREIPLDQEQAWNETVSRFGNASAYFSHGYASAVQTVMEGKCVLLHFTEGSREAINVVSISQIPDTDLADMKSPNGFYGWIADAGKDFPYDSLDVSVQKYARQNRIVSAFTRCNPMIRSSEIPLSGRKRAIGMSVVLDISDRQKIWSGLHSGVRNDIRRSESSGVEVVFDPECKQMEAFVDLYEGTMLRKEALGHIFSSRYYEALKSAQDCFVANVYAVYQSEIIASALFIGKNGLANYHLSGSDPAYAKLCATKAIIYRAAEELSSRGFSRLDLGGGVGAAIDSLLQFKSRFTKDSPVNSYAICEVYDRIAYESLSKGRSDSEFFPAYRRK